MGLATHLRPVLGLTTCLILAAPGCSDDASGEDDVLGSDAADSGIDSGFTSSSGESGEATSSDSSSGSTTGPLLDLGDSTTGTAETGEVCNEDVDIVFVMDVSTTMGPFLDKLEQEINAVDTALNALNLPSPPQYGLVVFVDDVLISNAGAPYTDVNQLRMDFEMWNNFTASNQQVQGGGSNSTWPENSLDALYIGASTFQWRPAETTLRLIIHTTDDTFWDGPTTGNGVAIQHGYADTVSRLQLEQIRVFTFAALIGGSCNCEDVSPGWSAPYMGMNAIPESTGGGWWNIDEVLANQISLSASIDQAVDDTMCVPYPPPD